MKRVFPSRAFIDHPMYAKRHLWAALVLLVAFLVVFRTYRIVRRVRRRR